MAQSLQLLFEPYLDAALHDVLLHLRSQISDHMPCTDSFPVLLPLPIYSRVCNIHIKQQFSRANAIDCLTDAKCFMFHNHLDRYAVQTASPTRRTGFEVEDVDVH